MALPICVRQAHICPHKAMCACLIAEISKISFSEIYSNVNQYIFCDWHFFALTLRPYNWILFYTVA